MRPRKDIVIAPAPEELGYVIGVLFSDGHLTRNRMMLGATDKEFVEEWAAALNIVFPGVEARIQYVRRIPGARDVYECNPRSVVVAPYLKKRTSAEWCLRQPKDVKAAVLRGMWDGDGHITVGRKSDSTYPTVSFTSANVEMAELYRQLVLEVLDTQLNLLGPYGMRQFYRVEKRGYAFARHFYGAVSPTIERKRDRFRRIT